MEDQQVSQSPQSPDEGRRKLLKLAAAAGSAVAATAVLPGSWTKPVAHIGALPAHAQTSDVPITIAHPAGGPDIVGYEQAPPDVSVQVINGLNHWNIQAKCLWTDELGEFDDLASLYTRVDGECIQDKPLLEYPYFSIAFDGQTAGTLTFNVLTPCLSADTLEWYLHQNGRQSNPLSGPITKFSLTEQ